MRMLPRNFDFDNMFDAFSEAGTMKCDIYEKDGNYFLEADLPGMKKSDINVDYENGYITIKAEKNEETKDEEKNFIRQERFYGSVERKFYVGDIDESKIEASFDKGVLKLNFPKESAEKTSKSIEIK